MTIDEAINREEALAYSFGERYKRLGEPVGDLPELEAEHKQYAEWLRELKAYREELPKEIKNVKVRQANVFEANAKNENYNPYLAEYIKGYLCGLSYTEGIIAKIIGEVNADADRDCMD
ncbi:MAG: hypothetical protein J6S67_16280 [Methanobrevibacter sp.]|nr:hypothetical protein [Methanobrevibacter sp.]